MNFQVFGNRIRIFFLFTVLFLFLTIAMFVTFLVLRQQTYLLLFIWFGSATTLLFHYLLLKTLPFLQKLDLANTNNYSFFLTLVVYIIFFPVISILSLIFLIIFAIAILVLWIMNCFHKRKEKNKY